MTESVWDYPRPPRVEATLQRVRVVFDGAVIAETFRALRVLGRTGHGRPVAAASALPAAMGAVKRQAGGSHERRKRGT